MKNYLIKKDFTRWINCPTVAYHGWHGLQSKNADDAFLDFETVISAIPWYEGLRYGLQSADQYRRILNPMDGVPMLDFGWSIQPKIHRQFIELTAFLLKAG